ncbi:hypothetical protein LPJ63_002831 [Coemansia sp. RSA 2711]|nr:hypothetical protein LPJ63_002831 [Coemansia sp. RSA 2711]KAJ2302614.1 hypothetical protein IWW54_005981 [Coemansia sp. RSA 2705]KAJ2308736.1 hypothetical protein IWW52_005844 [Coemansia sp. RSA 2704]KAJ2359818.1 hypothetical protein H4S01_005996 [Coemansia sp. RSA 2610]KAJ2368471.1 hypothetical protein H4S02_010094 [Coemansia sp. RSA 2611]KAJ2714668.1 hypothetical protein H4R23_005736 [Coemansia sp. Cherry 401B]
MATEMSTCEQSLAKAYDVVAKIDRLAEKAYEAHSSIYKTFGDLSGISTIRKDKSVAEAAHTDISSTLEAMQDMIGTLAQLEGVVEQLEKKPREKLISDEVRSVLDEFSPYVRLMTEQGNVREISELIDGSVGELDASAMRLKIGDFGEGISETALEEQIVALRERYPRLDIKVHKVTQRTRLLVVRIPTVIQMSINMKQLDSSSETQQLEINAINIFSDDELGPFSKFHVFQRISYDSNIIWSSIAGFSVEHRISKIVQWFSMFGNLFSATCSICLRHLQIDPRTSQHLPPLWRDLDAKGSGPCKAFHYGCLESA